ncbi:TetR/AcrR family transcriptional regulator [Micromonospora sp. R77]|uniref:TetR/AcrR family transcriptional regulator n=1 Tax=Micromonospora sp. R77 TaxID=2925836 RepID=UPI002415EC52|nr:TetR/AcrR family transcriptional regulator [Micromonospora sp. R77]
MPHLRTLTDRLTVPSRRYSKTVRRTREQLLDAATRVLLRDGAEHVTLSAVAAEAGVSKGGLLYHFASKAALAAGLVDRLVGRFDAAMHSCDERPGAATRTYLAHSVGQTPAGDRQAAAAVLAGLLMDPASLAPLRERYTRWQHRLENDGIDPAVATVVRLAADGWWQAELLDLAPPDPALREQVLAMLDSLITGGD